MRAERQAQVDYLKELFAINERKARLMINGQAFYNPVTRRVAEKKYLLCNNCAWKAHRIREWIDNAVNRSSYEPGYDDRIRNYIMFAEITETVLRQHLKSISHA